ncbi:Glucose-methanol-choline (GMC) oxidoreductase family protein [Rhynchospora pubera]|uniref:Glucose-methanol-choline (GMC) oxidoreductase family protein n=1 Tax=Rhynchospora pubera TaxID=906938 RepID=A0AAV8EE13_9POAL|nr:Glucose-methanol-choline (GMC) oxidoreductase family protein [Rhynchospora pubera]
MEISTWRSVSIISFTILAFLGSGYSQQAPRYSFLNQAAEAPVISYYDYIIIGGGTAGCPLAATLSQNYKVLLLERGDAPYGNKNISNMVNFPDTLQDTSPTSPAQRFVSEDGVINSRARVLGGGSCLNAGFYTRASPNYVREAGWDGRLANESYEWVEKIVAFEPTMPQWQTALKEGLLEVGVTPFNGFTYDHEFGTKIGGTIFDSDGNRHTAADLLEYANPEGLTVLLHARVSRILFKVKGRSRPQAFGVIFWDQNGRKHKAYLNKGTDNEIILSAGALGSPQLLILSGIGSRDQLGALNITVVLDQPMVGQGMSDNPMNAIFVPSPNPVATTLIQVVGITTFGCFIEGASGSNFMVSGSNSSGAPGRNFGMFSPQTGQLATVPPKERTPEAIARAVEAMNSLEEYHFQGGFILEKTRGPLSTGFLKLNNRNIDENPSVTFNYFKEPDDLERCVRGIEAIERIIKSPGFSNFTYSDVQMGTLLNISTQFPVNTLPRSSDDTRSPEQYCRDTVMTIWHYHGGCQVGQVVDLDYKVIGTDALRVVDGSTFRFSPGTNPQATVMMLGRYMGIKIQNERFARQQAKRRNNS